MCTDDSSRTKGLYGLIHYLNSSLGTYRICNIHVISLLDPVVKVGMLIIAEAARDEHFTIKGRQWGFNGNAFTPLTHRILRETVELGVWVDKPPQLKLVRILAVQLNE